MDIPQTKKIPLAEFKFEMELSQIALGSMFGLSQGAVSEALRTSLDGSRVFSISKAGKCDRSGSQLYQMSVEKTISVGTLPWE
tara:strand:+ start:2740 stop:2988 length:249 start_codon:yes stop_codon:yes gene_type:complete